MQLRHKNKFWFDYFTIWWHLRLEYLETTNQTADIFTKPLPKEKFLKHKCELNILSKDGDVEFGRDCWVYNHDIHLTDWTILFAMSNSIYQYIERSVVHIVNKRHSFQVNIYRRISCFRTFNLWKRLLLFMTHLCTYVLAKQAFADHS